MGCDRVNELMLDYLAGEMSDEARGTFKAHLDSCPECRRELEQVSVLVKVMEAETEIEAPAGEVAACLAAAHKALKPLPTPQAASRTWAGRLGDYAFGVGSILAFIGTAVVMSMFGWTVHLQDVLAFAMTHHVVVGIAAGMVALVTCFVPIFMHGQRRTVGYWQRNGG